MLIKSSEEHSVGLCAARFNIKKLCILFTECVSVIVIHLRTNSDYVYKYDVHWLVFITGGKCLLRCRELIVRCSYGEFSSCTGYRYARGMF